MSVSGEKKVILTDNLKNLVNLADSLVEARKTRLGSKDPYFLVGLSAMCLWAFVVEIRSSSYLSSNLIHEFNELVPSWTHRVGTACLVAAFFAHVMQIVTELDPFRKNLLGLAAFINGVSAVFYAISCLDWVPVVKGWQGIYIIPMRYLHWNMTSPIMIYILSHLTPMPTANAIRMISYITVAVLCAFVGSIDYGAGVPEPLATIGHVLALGTGVTLFLLLNYEVHHVYSGARNNLKALTSPISGSDRQQRQAAIRDQTIRCLYAQQIFFVLSWSIMPLTYFLSISKCIDTFTTECMFTLGDLATKVVFANVAISSNYLSLDAQLQLTRMAETENIIQKEAFISRVSHELRTPLNGIIGLSENILLNPGQLDAKHLKFLTTIRNSGHQLLSLINDILDTAAYKKGKIVIQHQQVDLEKLVNQVVEMLRAQVKPGVELTADFVNNVPTIVGDTMRLHRILVNLVSNALRATSVGSVSILVEALKGGLIRIEVRDTGTGIPSDRLMTLFSESDSGDESTGTGSLTGGATPGLKCIQSQVGLLTPGPANPSAPNSRFGLKMTKRLVEAHHGTIVVASELGAGTCFTIMLPVRQPIVGSSNN